MVTVRGLRLAPEPRSVRAARRTVQESVGDLSDDELDHLLLCTSEVVTNAVEHGAAPIELHVARTADLVRVEVRDASPLPPRLRKPTPEVLRGRGMLIVDRCADRWGVETRALTGKAVWFEIDVVDGSRSHPPTAPPTTSSAP
jgi:anti-sigma regulatory factor (Ser/Thr protein kinase)